MQENEQQYWQLISRGNQQAFEQVFKTYYPLLCNYAGKMLRDADEGEEVVQNVFYNLWLKRESLQINSSVKSYVYKAVHNDCLNRIKHGKVKAVYAQDYKSSMNSGYSNGATSIETRELNQKINSAIDKLPEQCGNVFKLSRFEQLKYSEIAEQLNISVKTVENHMGKALKILREELKDYLNMILLLLFLH